MQDFWQTVSGLDTAGILAVMTIMMGSLALLALCRSSAADEAKSQQQLVKYMQSQLDWWQEQHETQVANRQRRWWALYEERIGKAVDERYEELHEDDEPSNKELLQALQQLIGSSTSTTSE